MLRYVYELWPDAVKKKDGVRATVAAPGECALATLRCVGGLWPDAAKEKDKVRATLAAPGERALATRDASLSLSLRPQDGWTPLHFLCRNEKATDEMLRAVGE